LEYFYYFRHIVLTFKQNFMKKLFLSAAFLTLSMAYAQPTIYSGDGVLATNRTIGLNAKNLNFSATASGNLFVEGTTGNVGIGNVTPSAKLDVTGEIKSKNIFATNSAVATTSFLNELAWYKNSYVLGVGYEMPHPGLSGATRRTFNVWDMQPWSTNVGANNDYFEMNIIDRNNKERLNFNGNKSGGAKNGASSFVINDKNGAENFKMIDNGSESVVIQMAKANSRIIIGGYGNYAPSLAHKLTVQNGSALIEGNILTNSNIGIGTTNFTDGADLYRLSVNGAIRANRVKVYTTWADYVFEDNYELPSLQQVEKHIKEKKHLQDIPSAAEVECNGIELGEMNKLLLQKVEELTLYIIEMDKKIKVLENKLN